MLSLLSSKNNENPCASVTQTDAGNSKPILIPGGISVLTLTLIVTSGSGKVQYSTSGAAAVDAGTAIWRDWPAGAVAVTTEDSLLSPVTAVRVACVSGAQTLEVVGGE